MSSVVAVVSHEGRLPDPAQVQRVLAEGTYTSDSQVASVRLATCVIGAAVVPITNEDTLEPQPVHIPGPEVYAVLAGRLDNREELLALLTEQGRREVSDCRLAALAYAKWGRSCPERMIGSFSLIIWDERNHELLASTDHLASRPLYHHTGEGRIVIASTIRQVLADRPEAPELDDGQMLATLVLPALGPILSSRTPYRSIRRLQPGTALSLGDAGRLTMDRYWRPERIEFKSRSSPDALAEELADALSRAVRAQSRSRSSIHSTLSGGLDSSSIACMLARAEESGQLECDGWQALSLVYPDTYGIDESGYRRAVAEKYSFEIQDLLSDQWAFRGEFDSDGATTEEPVTAQGGLFEMSELAKATSKGGSRVLLAGLGGDEMTAGNENLLADYLRTGRIRSFIAGAGEFSRLRNRTLYGTLMYSGLLAMPPLRRLVARHALGKYGSDRERPERFWIQRWPSWVVRTRSAVRAVREVFDELPEHRFRYGSVATCQAYQGQHVPVVNDSVFLPRGVEFRTPFYDRRVMEACLSSPGWLKWGLDGGSILEKQQFRSSMRGILPEVVRERRTKATSNALVKVGIDREWCGIWNEGRFRTIDRGYCSEAELHRALKAWRHGRWPSSGARMYSLIAVESWLRRLG